MIEISYFAMDGIHNGILKLLTKLAKTEKSYQYDEIFKLLKHPVEFEEIPLITRTGREKPFLKILSPKQLNLFF